MGADSQQIEGQSDSDDGSDIILGIDLGTTNSAAAVMTGGEPEILNNAQGSPTTPSVVSSRDGEILVGQPAKNQAVQNVSNTVESVKRSMGERTTFDLEGEEYTPEQISSLILTKARNDAEMALGESVDRAVITVPAYFSDRQRTATKQAGEIAGLTVERIVNEPTAAAMAFGIDEEIEAGERRTVMVCDLGGGTFDVSILSISAQNYQVESTSGDTELGGDDWDRALVNWVIERFSEEHGINLRADDNAMQRLFEQAEKVKKELSATLSTQFSLPYIATDEEGNSYSIGYEVSRGEFEEMTAHLVEQIEGPVKQAMADAAMNTDNIDDVLLIGGSTRMPVIRDHIQRLVGTEPRTDVNPDEAVALGAAIQAGIIGDEIDDMVLNDVTPLSLGVEVTGGMMETIITRNTTIPTRESKTFTTAEDDQQSVTIRVYQGERDKVDGNVQLGEFELTGIPPADAGVPQIDVSFAIDQNGIMNVSAIEEKTGRSADIQIEGGVGLSADEVEQMKEDAWMHASEDEERRREMEVRTRLKRLIRNAESYLDEYGDRIADKHVTGLEGSIQQAQGYLNDDPGSAPVDQLETAAEDFNEILNQVLEHNLDDYEFDTVGEDDDSEVTLTQGE